MARGRMLSASVSTSTQLADLPSDTARLLHAWTIPHLDRDGRISADARVLRATVCPLLEHVTTADVIAAVDAWIRVGLVAHIEDVNALEFPNFRRHQTGMRYHREPASKFSVHTSTTEQARQTSGRLPADIRQSAGVHPPEVNEVKVKEEKRREEKRKEVKEGGVGETKQPACSSKQTRGSRLPLDWRPSEDDYIYARESSRVRLGRKLVDAVAEDFRDYWLAKAGAGATKLDWGATFRGWMRRERERRPQLPEPIPEPKGKPPDAPPEPPTAIQEAMREANAQIQAGAPLDLYGTLASIGRGPGAES